MKKIVLATATLFVATFCYSQTVNYNPAVTATSYTFFTDDIQHPTVLQEIEAECFSGSDTTAALHISTTPLTITNFSFAPGYYYTFQIKGTATVSGNISQPPSNLTFGIALWPAQSNVTIYQALNNFPNAYTMESYAGSVPIYCFNYSSTTDLFGTWLTSFSAVSTMANSSTQGFSVVTPQFVATSTTNQLTIELAPVLGDEPSLSTTEATLDPCGCTMYRPLNPTNAVLTINSITVTKIPIQSAAINGSSTFSFSSSTAGGGGNITAAPGATVTVTVSGSGAPGGNYTTECNIFGATFSTGSSSLLVTNGSNSATFVMPAAGTIQWTGNYSYTSSAGGGSISVH